MGSLGDTGERVPRRQAVFRGPCVASLGDSSLSKIAESVFAPLAYQGCHRFRNWVVDLSLGNGCDDCLGQLRNSPPNHRLGEARVTCYWTVIK